MRREFVHNLGNKVLADYCPSREEMIKEKAGVAHRAKDLGVSDKDAQELAVLACAGIPWASRKFRIFLKEMCDDTLWQPDDLFPMPLPDSCKPTPPDFENVLKKIYRARSEAVHTGQQYGASISLGTGAGIPIRGMQELFTGGAKVPPVAWFERVVNLALNRYLETGLKPSFRSL
jgi:hypothetical protein